MSTLFIGRINADDKTVPEDPNCLKKECSYCPRIKLPNYCAQRSIIKTLRKELSLYYLMLRSTNYLAQRIMIKRLRIQLSIYYLMLRLNELLRSKNHDQEVKDSIIDLLSDDQINRVEEVKKHFLIGRLSKEKDSSVGSSENLEWIYRKYGISG